QQGGAHDHDDSGDGGIRVPAAQALNQAEPFVEPELEAELTRELVDRDLLVGKRAHDRSDQLVARQGRAVGPVGADPPGDRAAGRDQNDQVSPPGQEAPEAVLRDDRWWPATALPISASPPRSVSQPGAISKSAPAPMTRRSTIGMMAPSR